jgi:hypothetical protein
MDSLVAAEKMIHEIRGSEAKLRRIIDTIPALVSCFLPDGSNEFMSQRWHGYTALLRTIAMWRMATSRSSR